MPARATCKDTRTVKSLLKKRDLFLPTKISPPMNATERRHCFPKNLLMKLLGTMRNWVWFCGWNKVLSAIWSTPRVLQPTNNSYHHLHQQFTEQHRLFLGVFSTYVHSWSSVHRNNNIGTHKKSLCSWWNQAGSYTPEPMHSAPSVVRTQDTALMQHTTSQGMHLASPLVLN